MAENALLDAVERTVLDTPDALAFEVEGERTTYGELWAASDSVAAAISAHSRDDLSEYELFGALCAALRLPRLWWAHLRKTPCARRANRPESRIGMRCLKRPRRKVNSRARTTITASTIRTGNAIPATTPNMGKCSIRLKASTTTCRHFLTCAPMRALSPGRL